MLFRLNVFLLGIIVAKTTNTSSTPYGDTSAVTYGVAPEGLTCLRTVGVGVVCSARELGISFEGAMIASVPSAGVTEPVVR